MKHSQRSSEGFFSFFISLINKVGAANVWHKEEDLKFLSLSAAALSFAESELYLDVVCSFA